VPEFENRRLSQASLLSSLNQDLHDARSCRETVHQAPTRSYESGGHCFGVCLFGFAIYVEAPSSEVMELLDRCVFPSIPRTDIASSCANLCLRVVQDAHEFRLYRDDCFVASAPRAEQLLRDLMDCLDRGFVEGVRNLSAVHAGAVLLGDRALLFPGASHSGKSSLVAELLRQGAICYSDEYALIDSEGLVHAYPRPLLLRNGGREQTAVLPIELNARVASSPAKVGWILSLQYEAEGSWNIQEVSQGQGLLSLLQNTPHVLADSPHIVGSFRRAAAGARCFEGQRGDWSDAVSRIMQLALAA
jgi:hypothetical protein